MERLSKKYEHRYKRAQEAVEQWSGAQARLVRLFGSASAVIQRIPLLMDKSNYGVLKHAKEDIQAGLQGKQMESLERILAAMRETLAELEAVCKTLERIWRDGNNLLNNEKPKPTPEQRRQRVGSRASLEDCVNGLRDLYLMHRDELVLKLDIVSAVTYDTRTEDLSALQTVLTDQPNIPPDEVESIFDFIFARSSS